MKVDFQKRHVLEEQNDLLPKENYLENDMDDVESSSDEEEVVEKVRSHCRVVIRGR